MTTLKKYKVEITKTYCVDVLAETQSVAEDRAEEFLNEVMLNGTEHYLQTGDTNFYTFDTTETDDYFNPIN